MKESDSRQRNVLNMRVTSTETMAADKETEFDKAVDALLAELVNLLDRHDGAVAHEQRERQMAG